MHFQGTSFSCNGTFLGCNTFASESGKKYLLKTDNNFGAPCESILRPLSQVII